MIDTQQKICSDRRRQYFYGGNAPDLGRFFVAKSSPETLRYREAGGASVEALTSLRDFCFRGVAGRQNSTEVIMKKKKQQVAKVFRLETDYKPKPTLPMPDVTGIYRTIGQCYCALIDINSVLIKLADTGAVIINRERGNQ